MTYSFKPQATAPLPLRICGCQLGRHTHQTPYALGQQAVHAFSAAQVEQNNAELRAALAAQLPGFDKLQHDATLQFVLSLIFNLV